LSVQIEAVRLSAEAGRDFSSEFPEQFVLSRDHRLGLPGWDHKRLKGVSLWRAPGARTKRLLNRRGSQIGWLLGEAVDGDGCYLRDPIIVPVANLGSTGLAQAETWLEGLAGRYVVVLVTDRVARLYQDPVGDFSVVWDPETSIVASSVLLALARPIRWNPEFDRRGVLDGDVHFSLGHTPDAGIRRVLPNHYLDLDQMTLTRHWPREETDFEVGDDDLQRQVGAISDRLATILRALVTNAPCLLPISGGRDSRNLAALLGPAASSLVSGFAIQFHMMSRIDTQVGAAIAERIGVPFLPVPYRKTTRPERLGYYRHTGFADGAAALHVLGSHLSLPPGNLLLRGNVMELLRANQWNDATIRRGGEVRTAFGLRRLLIRMGPGADAAVAKFAGQYEAWADTLPRRARKRQLDLAFCEHLLPNTLGIRHFGYTANFVLNPFACRRLIHLAMQISPRLRAEDRPNSILLARNCGHLSDIPFEREVASGAEIPDRGDD
jgi:hypothetical protein